MIPRRAEPEDFQPTAQLWFDAWHETKAPHVPDTLIALRELASFTDQVHDMGDDLRVAGPIGAPTDMCAIQSDVMDQLFIAPAGRGTGAGPFDLLCQVFEKELS